MPKFVAVGIVIPYILLSGYSYRVFHTVATGHDQVPGLDNFQRIFKEGLYVVLVFLLYITTIFAIMYLDQMFIRTPGGHATFVYYVGLMLLIIGFVLFPVAETNMVVKQRLLAAGDLKSILRAALTKDYLIVVVFTGVLFCIWVIGWMFFMALSGVLLVTFVLLPTVYWAIFYIQMVLTHLVGSAIGGKLG